MVRDTTFEMDEKRIFIVIWPFVLFMTAITMHEKAKEYEYV